MDLWQWKETLEKAGVEFAAGLTPEEIREAEQSYAIAFPEDLAELRTTSVGRAPSTN